VVTARPAHLRRLRRSACGRGAAALLVAALALLPAACLCAAAPAVAAPTPAAHACHGTDDQPAPAAPEHRPDCTHCQAGIALPAASSATVSLPAVAVAMVTPLDAMTLPAWTVATHRASRAAHPPGRSVLRSKCVLRA
jgi:hypothetical protein